MKKRLQLLGSCSAMLPVGGQSGNGNRPFVTLINSVATIITSSIYVEKEMFYLKGLNGFWFSRKITLHNDAEIRYMTVKSTICGLCGMWRIFECNVKILLVQFQYKWFFENDQR